MSSPGELTEIRALLFQLVNSQGETREAVKNLRDDVADLKDDVATLKEQRQFTAGRASVWSTVVAAVTSFLVAAGARQF
jgi:hypothetical protein